MQDLIKSIWFVLFIFFILGILSLIPMDKYQESYLKELRKVKSAPQERVDATYRYVDAIEEGVENPDYFTSEPPQKYYAEKSSNDSSKATASQPGEKYKKPLYVRDKNNPKILHPYRSR